MPGAEPAPAASARQLARQLARRWPLSVGYDVRDLLLHAYADPRRGHHDLRHLAEVLDALEVLLEELGRGGREGDSIAVRLAAWFHDAVYDGAADDEERSARLAQSALPNAGVDAAVVAEVARLVRLTATHDPDADDLAGAVLSDADLAVLAAHADRYADYVAGVRREYAHVPDPEFRAGRAEVLRQLLAAPTLFRTAAGRRRWEQRARANVEAELVTLLR